MPLEEIVDASSIERLSLIAGLTHCAQSPVLIWLVSTLLTNQLLSTLSKGFRCGQLGGLFVIATITPALTARLGRGYSCRGATAEPLASAIFTRRQSETGNGLFTGCVSSATGTENPIMAL